MNNKIRLDKYLVDKKNIETRNLAKKLIEKNCVKVNNIIVNKISHQVKENDLVEIIENKEYVSRGAYKLIKAIDEFKINLNNSIVLDIGSSTGGFTQVLLENNVSKVYALDVGTNQLSPLLKNNPKVVSIEQTNFKNVNESQFKDINFITCDVSFISVKKILLKIKELNWKNLKGVFLLKPQFELTSKEISMGNGKVNHKYLENIKKDFMFFCASNNFKIINIIESPITGAKKQNIEYLTYLEW